MKEFYSIALATAVALSASAATGLNLRGNADFANKKLMTKTEAVAKFKTARDLKVAEASLKKANKAAVAVADVTGEYTFTFGDYYFQSSIGEFEDNVVVTSENGVLYFEPESVPVFAGTLNETAGTITFTKIKFGEVELQVSEGQYNTFYVQAEPFVYNATTQNLDLQDITGTYAGGAITFEADNGISWVAYTDAAYSNMAGYLDIEDLISAVKGSNTEDDTDWVTVGKAKLMDGWILPCFGFDQTDKANQYEVDLQRNLTTSTIFRLVDPYKGASPVAQYNESTKTGYITLDVTDPDHVTFLSSEAGFANSQLGISKFYCINVLTWAMNYFDTDNIDALAAVFQQYGEDLLFTTFKNGVVELKCENTSEGYSNDACFGIQGEPNASYQWSDDNDNALNMACKITFPETYDAINGVAAGEADAPVRYYNLQGIEISTPATGQVVIRRQGDKATKILAR